MHVCRYMWSREVVLDFFGRHPHMGERVKYLEEGGCSTSSTPRFPPHCRNIYRRCGGDLERHGFVQEVLGN